MPSCRRDCINCLPKSERAVAIVDGLALSQLLTLYTTPMFYLFMNKFRRKKTHVPRLMTAIEGSAVTARE